MRKPLQQRKVEMVLTGFSNKENTDNISDATVGMRKFFSQNNVKQITFGSLASIVVAMGSLRSAMFWSKVFRQSLSENELRSLRRRLASRHIKNKALILRLLKNPKDKSKLPSRSINVFTLHQPAQSDGKKPTCQQDILDRIYGRAA